MQHGSCPSQYLLELVVFPLYIYLIWTRSFQLVKKQVRIRCNYCAWKMYPIEKWWACCPDDSTKMLCSRIQTVPPSQQPTIWLRDLLIQRKEKHRRTSWQGFNSRKFKEEMTNKVDTEAALPKGHHRKLLIIVIKIIMTKNNNNNDNDNNDDNNDDNTNNSDYCY